MVDRLRLRSLPPADERDVAPGRHGEDRRLSDAVAIRDRLHLQRVGDDRSAEPQPFPQQAVKYLPGQGGRQCAVERGVHHVGGHERRDPLARGAAEGEEFAAKERLSSRPDDRKLFVGVGGRVPVSREMFPDREDPPGERSLRERDPESGRGVRVRGERPVPDHRVARVAVHVEDRGEVHVDPHRPQFGGDRRAQGFRHGLVPAAEEGAGAGRGKVRERSLAEPRDAAAFLVDRDQREGISAARGGTDLAAQGAHLGGAIDIAGEEDHAPDLPVREPPRQRRGERFPFKADPQGGGGCASSRLHFSRSAPPDRRSSVRGSNPGRTHGPA